MRISSNDTLAGQPILVIRRLLRAGGGFPWTRARQDESGCDGPLPWRITTKGRALAMASARSPVHRKTADRVLAEFLERVANVRGDERFLYTDEKGALQPSPPACR
jgi:hypothetical protein